MSWKVLRNFRRTNAEDNGRPWTRQERESKKKTERSFRLHLACDLTIPGPATANCLLKIQISIRCRCEKISNLILKIRGQPAERLWERRAGDQKCA